MLLSRTASYRAVRFYGAEYHAASAGSTLSGTEAHVRGAEQNTKTRGANAPRVLKYFRKPYLAYSVLRVSRMTLTRICPGYSICSSMRLAISFAITLMPSSVTSSGFTMMRTSRPDWIA